MNGVPELVLFACVGVAVAFVLSRFTPLLLRLGRRFQLLFGEPQVHTPAGGVVVVQDAHRYVLHGIDEDD